MRNTGRRFLTPLDIPEGKVGTWAITRTVHPPGEVFELANMRCRLFGQDAGCVAWPVETLWHELSEDGRIWMTDLPCEMVQTYAAVRGLRGRVLLGGLGLGLAATILARSRAVSEIVAVEVSGEAIELVAPYLSVGQKLRVVHRDLFNYLRTVKGGAFDSAFYDIWASDGEGTFFDTVCPLYDASYGKVKRPPRNWNENVMRGQLLHSIHGRLLYETGKLQVSYTPQHVAWEEDGTKAPWHNWTVPFFRWWKAVGPSAEEAQRMAGLYVGLYGTWNWGAIWKARSGQTGRRTAVH